ncbi:MAG: hypothetical protein A2033_06065 [Bacteroidetes bacterium GWA2_31_9]|nr:MAG: hypothetical protein A2033_06065 [Bacteroidetes bacterium GWA2_31_9]
MEGFSYSNIFETKGIEYIAIIAFFMILVPFWILLNKKGAIKQKIQNVLKFLSFDVLKIPQGVFYSKNHTWAFLEKSGIASVGLDDFLLHTTGEVQLQNIKKPGEVVSKGDLLTELTKNNNVLKIYSPISGIVQNFNFQINEFPELLGNDPYGKGWVYKIKPTNWIDETQSLYLADEATNWSKIEMQRFKDFLAQSSKKISNEPSLIVLQDGGELIDNTLSHLPDVVWKDFQDNFLKV